MKWPGEVNKNVKLVEYTPGADANHTKYTVKVDVSKVAGYNGWSNERVHAHFGEITAWPGVTGVYDEESGTVTFSAYGCYKPTCIVFNNGLGGGSGQTVDLDYEEGKTYVLHKKGTDMFIEDWGTDKEILIYGQGFDGAGMHDSAPEKGIAMTWNPDQARYEAVLNVTNNEDFSFNFWFDGAYRRPVQPQAVTPLGYNLRYSDPFENENTELMVYDSFSNGDNVGIYLYQDDNAGTPCYALKKVTDELPVFTIKVDLSRMGKRKWNNLKNVSAFFKSNGTDMHVWPGITGYSIDGDVVTFKFQNDVIPTQVIFNDGVTPGPGGLHQSQMFPFEEKTYVLEFQDGKWVEGEASAQLPTVNLPYGPNDFAEPKYFLVGARMGTWHLQPEWELIKQPDGTYKTKGGRYIFRGNFAVARVKSYNDYIYHYYDLYSKLTGSSITPDLINQNGLLTIQDIEYQQPINGGSSPSIANAEVYPYVEERAAEMLAMTFRLNTDTPVTETEARPDHLLATFDKGAWCKSITLTPTGEKFSLTFDLSEPTSNDNRIFTLVGSHVIHDAYAEAEGFQTPRAQIGWQESWIQYDHTGKPYYDANHDYLYHTAYTGKIFEDKEVKFQIDIPDGNDLEGNEKFKKFNYTSSSITFFEANQLDLTNDPYRDLYKALEGHKDLQSNMTVQGGDPRKNTDFSFTFGTLPRQYTAENADWKVFVVRDAWVNGQFKIWSGWGGNTISNECLGSPDTNARWNRLSAGPSNKGLTAGNDRTAPIVFTNVRAGANGEAQEMNPLYVDQGSGCDYKVNDLTYFSRIIFLYNTGETDAMANSYVMFIQGDNQPVIQAFLEGEDNKRAYAEWNLVNVNLPTNATITGYSLYRYSVTDEGNVNPVKVDEGLDLNWTIADLSSHLPANYHEPANLNPGSYRYYIKVHYSTPQDGNTVTGWRDAYSNTITIYGEELTPDLRVEQLVALNNAGFDAIGAAEMFKEGTTPAEYAPDRYYLTYRENNPKADYFVLQAGCSTDDNKNISFNDIKMKEVDAQTAIDVLADPNKYIWVSRFYVRALNFTNFRRHYNRQFIPFETPVIALKDCSAHAESQDENSGWSINAGNMATNFMDMSFLDGSTVRYIGSIVDRKGLLREGDMEANMTYTYGTDNKQAESSASVPFAPVVPQPYNLTYRYVYRAIENGTPVKNYINANPGKIKTLFGEKAELASDYTTYYQMPVKTTVRPKPNSVGGADAVTEYANKVEDVYIKESDLTNERHLDCFIEFTRPNVSENIFQYYTVFYKLRLSSEVKEDAVLTDQEKLFYTPGNESDKVEAWYYDPFANGNGNELTPDAANKPYSIRITDTHPSGSIYPHFEIKDVYFVRKTDLNNTELTLENKRKLKATHQYEENGLKIDAINDETNNLVLKTVELGFNPENLSRGEGLQWFLCRHSDLTHTATPDDHVSGFEPTKHYLIELTTPEGGYGFSRNLWCHDHDDSVKDEENLYAPGVFYVASIPHEGDIPVPSVKFTPVYLYYRNLTDGNRVITTQDVIDLAKYEEPSATAQSAPRRTVKASDDLQQPSLGQDIATREDDIKAIFAKDQQGKETNKIIGIAYDTTNDPNVIVHTGKPVIPELLKDENENVIMTGIEDVVTDKNAGSESVYYNLQGIRVANPVKGRFYIRRTGSTTEKILY